MAAPAPPPLNSQSAPKKNRMALLMKSVSLCISGLAVLWTLCLCVKYRSLLWLRPSRGNSCVEESSAQGNRQEATS